MLCFDLNFFFKKKKTVFAVYCSCRWPKKQPMLNILLAMAKVCVGALSSFSHALFAAAFFYTAISAMGTSRLNRIQLITGNAGIFWVGSALSILHGIEFIVSALNSLKTAKMFGCLKKTKKHSQMHPPLEPVAYGPITWITLTFSFVLDGAVLVGVIQECVQKQLFLRRSIFFVSLLPFLSFLVCTKKNLQTFLFGNI